MICQLTTWITSIQEKSLGEFRDLKQNLGFVPASGGAREEATDPELRFNRLGGDLSGSPRIELPQLEEVLRSTLRQVPSRQDLALGVLQRDPTREEHVGGGRRDFKPRTRRKTSCPCREAPHKGRCRTRESRAEKSATGIRKGSGAYPRKSHSPVRQRD